MLFVLLAKKQDNSEIMLKWKKKQGGFFYFLTVITPTGLFRHRRRQIEFHNCQAKENIHL